LNTEQATEGASLLEQTFIVTVVAILNGVLYGMAQIV